MIRITILCKMNGYRSVVLKATQHKNYPHLYQVAYISIARMTCNLCQK